MADYSISNVPRRVVYAADGVGPYAFTFEILAQTDVAVYKDDALLTLTTDYTVIINVDGTGTITLVAAPTGATQIAIVGARAIQRLSDFTTGGDFFAVTVNEELDSLTIFAQQNAEALGRTLTAPQTDPTTIDMTLPRAADRAGKYLAFDENGNPEPGDTAVEVAAVFAIKDEIEAVAAIDAEVVTVAGISANVTTVAGISANVTTVAGIASDVTAVAADATDIGTVAADLTGADTIGAVAGVATEVAALGPIAADITTVAGISADVTTVAGVSADVDVLGGIAADITTVAGISTDVTAVAADATDIGIVATNIANVNTVAGISANVTTVAGISADVTSVAADAADIGTVAANITNVNTVAGISANVTTVAGISADVTAVAADAADIGTVAANIANVNTVAGISADVTTVAGLDTEITALGARTTEIDALYAEIDDIGTKVTKTSDTGAAILPSGTEAQRDAAPLGGYLRFNTDLDEFEGYNGTAWASVGGSAISNDTATTTDLYPTFVDATTGTALNIFTSNAKLLYKPSTGELKSEVLVAQNGIVVNSATVSEDYTIEAGFNASSAGPISVDDGVTVTVSAGSVWTVI
jgi:hypothetical protein